MFIDQFSGNLYVMGDYCNDLIVLFVFHINIKCMIDTGSIVDNTGLKTRLPKKKIGKLCFFLFSASEISCLEVLSFIKYKNSEHFPLVYVRSNKIEQTR